MEKKTIIHEFDPCIYPRLLWVVKGGTLEGIQETLEITRECEEDEKSGALTIPVRRKEDNRFGYCIWFSKSGDIRRGDWIAHESTHAALCIFEDIGARISYEDQEPFAYLVGWIFECIDKVRKHKEVKNGGSESKSSDAKEVLAQETCEAKEEDNSAKQ